MLGSKFYYQTANGQEQTSRVRFWIGKHRLKRASIRQLNRKNETWRSEMQR